MKIWTSYFYMIRFFKPWMIPISTAAWDPKWFHEFKGNDHIWKDKNGVWNGIRLEDLNPDHCCSLPPECPDCRSNKNPDICSFIKDYREGLERLNFSEILECLKRTADYIQHLEGFQEEPEIILIVYEVPGNKCSERKSLQDYFMEHGIEVKEWEKEV